MGQNLAQNRANMGTLANSLIKLDQANQQTTLPLTRGISDLEYKQDILASEGQYDFYDRLLRNWDNYKSQQSKIQAGRTEQDQNLGMMDAQAKQNEVLANALPDAIDPNTGKITMGEKPGSTTPTPTDIDIDTGGLSATDPGYYKAIWDKLPADYRDRLKISKEGGDIENLADKGRFGDTELAHVNKFEKALLESLGGSGTVNPETGLDEYWVQFIPMALSLLGSMGGGNKEENGGGGGGGGMLGGLLGKIGGMFGGGGGGGGLGGMFGMEDGGQVPKYQDRGEVQGGYTGREWQEPGSTYYEDVYRTGKDGLVNYVKPDERFVHSTEPGSTRWVTKEGNKTPFQDYLSQPAMQGRGRMASDTLMVNDPRKFDIENYSEEEDWQWGAPESRSADDAHLAEAFKKTYGSFRSLLPGNEVDPIDQKYLENRRDPRQQQSLDKEARFYSKAKQKRYGGQVPRYQGGTGVTPTYTVTEPAIPQDPSTLPQGGYSLPDGTSIGLDGQEDSMGTFMNKFRQTKVGGFMADNPELIQEGAKGIGGKMSGFGKQMMQPSDFSLTGKKAQQYKPFANSEISSILGLSPTKKRYDSVTKELRNLGDIRI